MKKILLIISMLLLIPGFSSANDDIRIPIDLVQNEFDQFVEEFGTALLFNPMAPAEPLGTFGFDIGIEVVASDISESEGYWTKLVEDGDPPSLLPLPRLHVQKGLPFDIDVGAIYAQAPGSNIKLLGLEVKYAILSGSIVTPALSVRASYSTLQGVDDIDLSTQSIDLLISKGLTILTPYAGVSATRVEGSENSALVALNDVKETGFRGLVGLQISPFPLFIINAEAVFGEVTQYGLKVGLRF